eukprot:Nitzschia sp. Nitz4//scaffold102_size76354//15589//16511//NITZ4_005627-RA/size76354-snap-gene-0.133-mRNA-1//-1//CDS//3329532234//6475//frame0
MVAIPFFIAASLAMFDPEGTSEAKTRTWEVSDQSTMAFSYGMIIGFGLSSIISNEIRRHRVLERARVWFRSLWWTDSVSTGDSVWDKYRLPTPSKSIEGRAVFGKDSLDRPCAVRRLVVSPDWCPTSSMHVMLWTLFPGTEVPSQPAPGVEFYYVMEGQGMYLTEAEEFSLYPGVCFVVDPKSLRGFQATGREDLVLLRATDRASMVEDNVTRSGGPTFSTSGMLQAGLEKVEAMVKRYSSSNGGTSHV